jgi:hypothetical protein
MWYLEQLKAVRITLFLILVSLLTRLRLVPASGEAVLILSFRDDYRAMILTFGLNDRNSHVRNN